MNRAVTAPLRDQQLTWRPVDTICGSWLVTFHWARCSSPATPSLPPAALFTRSLTTDRVVLGRHISHPTRVTGGPPSPVTKSLSPRGEVPRSGQPSRPGLRPAAGRAAVVPAHRPLRAFYVSIADARNQSIRAMAGEHVRGSAAAALSVMAAAHGTARRGRGARSSISTPCADGV